MIIDSRYEVIKKLGSGVWASVYQVKDVRTKQIFALKNFHRIDAESLYEKFSPENMHQITKLRHPNLMHVIDFGNFGDNIYYLSEYFAGKTLNEFKFNSTNIDLLYNITVHICYALSALHSQNMLHKDLKPTNVVFHIKDNKPIVKVMDYGFSKMGIEERSQKINQNLPFIAPEIYIENEISKKSDFYSLGVILYKITTGILPYTAEQLSAIIAGDRLDIFPKFPRELNEDIPDELEKLILKLIEKNPEDRFDDIRQIITYINKVQPRKFAYSSKWSIVNRIQFSDYLVREDYAHKLYDYVPIVARGNGKIISISAGKGLGKGNALTLFRYHLLTNEYYIFDYLCSALHKDPFYALIKEFYNAAERNQKMQSDLVNISEKMREYLFESEEKATFKAQNEKELELDFKSASNFIYHLSEEKPIIFIIRAAEHLPKEVFDFVNYISRDILDRPIMVIISLNDPRKLEGLVHAVKLKIPALSLDHTKEYVRSLLNIEPSESFLKELWLRTNGNPMFIEKVLIDLTIKKIIWRDREFIFDVNLKKYELPKDILHDIYLRMAHLNETNYIHFQKIAWVKTKLSHKLLRFILEIDDKKLFFLLADGINNELVKKTGEYYQLTYREARNRFNRETTEKTKKQISQKVLAYFQNIKVTEFDFCQGIIEHALHIKDYRSVRKYYLGLVQIYADAGDYEEAFKQIGDVIILDLSKKIDISETDLRKDLKILMKYSEWTTYRQLSSRVKSSITDMPNIAEKHLLLGIYYTVLNKFNLAVIRLKKAYDLAISGRIRIAVLLRLCNVKFYQNDLHAIEEYLTEMAKYQLDDENEIEYVNFKGLFLGLTGKVDDGINLLEDFIPSIITKNDPNYLLKVGNIHNTLGFLYHLKKSLEEANKNFEITRKIWEKHNYLRKLGLIYNNIGDVALTKGDTVNAFHNFHKALNICEIADCKRIKVQTLLNHGQAYIKLGDYTNAEKYLNKALNFSSKLESKPFYNSIINNLAISRSKIKNFSYYRNFIGKHKPELMKGQITEVTPLTKTYFYYLYEIGDYDKTKILLEQYEDQFISAKEHEFYYQMLGFLDIKKNNFQEARKKIEQAFRYSKENMSDYAQTINCIRLMQCYIGMEEAQDAYSICKKAEKLCEKHNFTYWETVLEINKIKVKLQDENINIRYLIRKLLDIVQYVKEKELFILELEAYSLLIQVYNYLELDELANSYFEKYRKVITNALKGIPDREKMLYKKKMGFNLKKYRNLKTVKIVKHKIKDSESWQEELFDILKLQDLKRMKFFIDRSIQKLFAPHFYAVILHEDMENKANPFLEFNLDKNFIQTPIFKRYYNKALDKNKAIVRKIKKSHVFFVPLKIKNAEVGILILADKGEFTFQDYERSIINILRLHLTSILMRINEFTALNKDMKLMTKLIEVTRTFYEIFDVEKLGQEVIAFMLDFTSGSRGFLIIKDEYENYKYKVAQDETKNLIKKSTFISKTVLREVQQIKEPIYIEDVLEDKLFDSYIEGKNRSFSVYCAPIIIDKEIYGYIYLDDFDSDNQIKINPEFMKLILIQISVAFKNAMQYQELRNKNQEISSLDRLKKDFINIVSHELRTPMTSLQGNVKRLKDLGLSEKDQKTVTDITISVQKLDSLIADLINFNKYQMFKTIEKRKEDLIEILSEEKKEMEQLSTDRHMQFKLEVDEELSQIRINRDAIKLMLKNILLNSIRFTKDFGTIIIGARYSTFQQEEINGKESVVIFVQDNGIGIPESEVSKVFQKFYELNDIISHSSGSIEYKSSGLGLGLATAKEIVQLHNGKIWINSKLNEGTTVFVAIPL